jgi:hypothetical protein
MAAAASIADPLAAAASIADPLAAAASNTDPLDAAGLSARNFMTGAAYTSTRGAAAARWSALPVYADKASLQKISKSLDVNRVTIVISATGSGKSVITPALVMRRFFGAGKRVGVTVPKKVLALAAAQYAQITLDCAGGPEIGYQYRGSPRGSHDEDRVRLLYMTDGTLLSQTRRDPLLSAYAAVVVDEVHERAVHTDMLLLALKEAMEKREDLHVVLMSATLDPAPFVAFFGAKATTVVEVPGGTLHPIRLTYAPRDSGPGAYLADGVKLVVETIVGVPVPGNINHANKGNKGDHHPWNKGGVAKAGGAATVRGDANGKKGNDANVKREADAKVADGNVLFFVATTRDANEGCKLFSAACPPSTPRCAVVNCAGLFGKLDKKLQDVVLSPVQAPFTRKLVFATNVAESSLTLNGLTHVVDSGMQLTSRWDAAAHGTVLEKGYATQAQILQRIGRVGRTAPGAAFLLYTKARFDALPKYPPPSILCVDVTDMLLQAVCDGGKTLAQAVARLKGLLTPVTDVQIASAVSMLHCYRLIEVTGPPGGAVPGKPGSVKPGSGKPVPGKPVTGKPGSGKPVPGKPGSGMPVTGKRGGGGRQALGFFDVPYGAEGGFSFVERGLDGGATAHGRWVQGVADRLRMGLWNALVVCAGVAYGCAEDALALAGILESSSGEMSSLWLTKDPRNHPALKRLADSESDHRTLLRVYREAFLEARQGSGNWDAAIARAGLKPFAWRGVHQRISADTRALDEGALDMPDGVAAGTPLYNLPALPGQTPFDRALMAARMYHVAKPAVAPPHALPKASPAPAPAPAPPASPSPASPHQNGGPKRGGGGGGVGNNANKWTTLAPPKRTTCAAEPDFAAHSGASARAAAVYESLMTTAEGSRLTTVTWFGQFPMEAGV